MAAFESATVGLVLWWSARNAFANPRGVLSVSRAGVGETADRIESDARARGSAVVERVDHASLARRCGLRIAPVETLLIEDAASGRVRFVVWREPGGATVVAAADRSGADRSLRGVYFSGPQPAKGAGVTASVG
jgi:hypothetical protein